MNASWGVPTSKGQFLSLNETTGEVEVMQILADVIRNLGGRSAPDLATVAISVTFDAMVDDAGKTIADESKAGISVKLQNFTMSRECDYHGP